LEYADVLTYDVTGYISSDYTSYNLALAQSPVNVLAPQYQLYEVTKIEFRFNLTATLAPSNIQELFAAVGLQGALPTTISTVNKLNLPLCKIITGPNAVVSYPVSGIMRQQGYPFRISTSTTPTVQPVFRIGGYGSASLTIGMVYVRLYCTLFFPITG
jgi:hypothetical protein